MTGGPGSGKSPLLSHALLAADPRLSATVPTPGPRPPTGAFDAALRLKGLTCEDVAARLADALGTTANDLDEPLVAVAALPPDTSFTVLVDALEEAASVVEARRITVLLRQVAAEPHAGGSLLAVHAARHTALTHDLPVLYAAPGLSRTDVATRVIAAAAWLDHVTLRTLCRSKGAKGFVVLPRRWRVERTLGWITNARRNARGTREQKHWRGALSELVQDAFAAGAKNPCSSTSGRPLPSVTRRSLLRRRRLPAWLLDLGRNRSCLVEVHAPARLRQPPQ